jgi:triosephosphate isomerase
MKKYIIAGNWKMNKNIAEAMHLATAISSSLQPDDYNKIDVIIAPPYTSINKVNDILKDSKILIAAQDLFWEESGAFTGAISATMIKDAGAKYVIIGHSERRQLFNETNADINKKIKTALKNNLIPIFCVGETLQERESNKIIAIIKTQLLEGLKDITALDAQKIVIAYEPIWAIGTGKTATPEQAEEAHLLIRKILTEKYDENISSLMKILYGGSVKPSNSKELLAKLNIDGALIGGASLKAEDFIEIIKNCI